MALTTVTLALTEQAESIVLTWTPDDTPTDRWEIWRDGGLFHTLYDVNAVTWRDLDIETNVQYSYVVKGEADSVDSSAVIGVAGSRAYGVVDPLVTDPRYTTLAALKAHLNIADADATFDDHLTMVVVAVEVAIDQHLERSFPDPSGGAIQGIPEAVKQVALSASIAVYNNTEMPAGSGGSDDWLGEQTDSIGEIIRREVRRSPLLTGFKVSFGVAGGGSL